MESWEWNLFTQEPDEETTLQDDFEDQDIEDAEVINDNEGPKLLEEGK